MKTTTAQKASKIIGIGPIKTKTIQHFEKIHGDLEKAKVAAVQEFLQYYLNYTMTEINDMGITATKLAKDDIVYVVLESRATSGKSTVGLCNVKTTTL